ncbi:MAG: CYTH domain-containing protein [Sedimentisphaerales bacterium]|nr:CYTH domain-containing protein [Sedimentisphaerales bacterium]
MTQPYECEIRFEIDDIKDFEARLDRLGARIALPYEFTDHYYKLPAGNWDPVKKNIRIRQWIQPQKDTTIYIVKLEIISIDGLQFKRSLYPEGKLPLFTGPHDMCRTLLDDLGFEFWFSLRKENACLWEVPRYAAQAVPCGSFFTAVEYIKGLGWTAELEFEGNDPQKAGSAIRQALSALQIPMQKVTHNPISAVYLQNIERSRNADKNS